jgi:uncharacterized protein YcbK (DUF882 family)
MIGNLTCPCCGKKSKPELEQFVRQMEGDLGITVKINSAARCEEYNKKVGGEKNSAHLTGEAIDLSIPDNYIRFKVLEYLIEHDIDRAGIGSKFLHFDISKINPRPRIWVY